MRYKSTWDVNEHDWFCKFANSKLSRIIKDSLNKKYDKKN